MAFVAVCLAKPLYSFLFVEEFSTKRQSFLLPTVNFEQLFLRHPCGCSILRVREQPRLRENELDVENCHGPVLREGDCGIWSGRLPRQW